MFVNAEQLALGQHERYITVNARTNRIIVYFIGRQGPVANPAAVRSGLAEGYAL